ncbi:hypothetical protein H2248_007807 [Termitomyces sp. 'cryptogamus']|nr:hypothetical protein H2248_007807 [Termitomyces sp. 'cryptogamus']
MVPNSLAVSLLLKSDPAHFTRHSGSNSVLSYMYVFLCGYVTEPLLIFDIVFPSEPVVVVAVSTPIQLFFAWRIMKLTKSPWISFIISFFAIVSFAGGCWTGIKISVIKLFEKKPQLHTPALVWFLSACVADVLITASLVYNLSKRKTGFVTTDDAISKIIRMTVQTGMLTAICAIGDVVFFMTLPRTALNFLWDLALSKLYTNCLLSALNARATLKENSAGSLRVARISTGNTRRPLDMFLKADTFDGPHDDFTSSTFELDTQKPHNHATSYNRDVEFGITVTKVAFGTLLPGYALTTGFQVVERMEEPRASHQCGAQ